MILEALVTTIGPSGDANIAPMGPWIGSDLTRFELRPFQTSQTFQNLRHQKTGVLHITDDVLPFAQAITGSWTPLPRLEPAEQVPGWVLADACRWFEFRVLSTELSGRRAGLHCETILSRTARDFWGFNRAKHAVLELAIAVSRIDFLPGAEVADTLRRCRAIVEKTGGDREHLALELLAVAVDAASARHAAERGGPC